MVESYGYTRIRGGGAESTAAVPSDMVVRPRSRKLEQSSSVSQEQYEVIAEHVDQVEYEFIAKLSIACVLLACLMVWLAWSFWWDKNMRRSVASRRRRGQRTSRLERTQSSGSPPPRGGDTSPSSQGTGVGAGYQRDAHAVGRPDQYQHQHQQQNRSQTPSNGQGTPLKEFFNPMWGKTNNTSRVDRRADFRERSTPPDRGDEIPGSARNATVAPRDVRPQQQQRRWRPPR